MTDNTRDKLIEISVQLIMAKGFNGTGIAEILAQAGVPKGSFYHYFKSKEDLGLAVIDYYGRMLSDGLELALSKPNSSPIALLRAYFDDVVVFFGQHQGRCNCLLGNLGQELALQSDTMREAIYRHYRRIEDLMAQCLSQAKAAGELPADADEQRLARVLFAAWEGSLTRAKLAQSVQPLRDLLDLYFEELLKH